MKNKMAAPITGMLFQIRYDARRDPTFTYATPRTMGKVKVELLTGFSQALEPQLPVDSAEDDAVVAARASTTRSGTATFIIVSILLTTCAARAANLRIFASPFSILAVTGNLAVNSTKSTSGGLRR
jgi:hypothetical protein